MLKKQIIAVAAVALGGCVGDVADTEPTDTSTSALASCGQFPRGSLLRRGESATSCDGRFTLSVQESDGNTVLRMGSTILFSAAAAGRGYADYSWTEGGEHPQQYRSRVAGLSFNELGYLVLLTKLEYLYGNKWLWLKDSDVWRSPAAGSYIALQNDGNLVIYSGASAPVWQLGTGGH